MSVQNKLSLARKLVSVLKKWPDDGHKIYNSFRNAQIKLYDTSTPSALPEASTLEARLKAAEALVNDANLKTFPASNSIYRPDGNPGYYERIIREANRQEPKTNLYKSFTNTVFGWWRK